MFAHRKHGMHGRFFYQRDYTDYTDFPRDPRDPWRQVGAPQGNLLIICLRRITGISRIFYQQDYTDYTVFGQVEFMIGRYGRTARASLIKRAFSWKNPMD